MLEESTLAHVLGNKSSYEILIKFHALDCHPLDNACIDVDVCGDLKIVGHGFFVEILIYKALAWVSVTRLEFHASTTA